MTKQILLIFRNYNQFDSNSTITDSYVITINFAVAIQEQHKGIKNKKYIAEKNMEKILTFEFFNFLNSGGQIFSQLILISNYENGTKIFCLNCLQIN